MSGYHAVTLPTRYSAGSISTISYDTRVVSLDSGVEERVARYNPWGRRKYTILQGTADTDLIRGLYEFYMLRQGSLNSFKFWDPLDHATTATRTTHRVGDANPGSFDVQLVSLGNRQYQAVARYSDGVTSIVRPITKIGARNDPQGTPSVGFYSLNGTPTSDDSVDAETGIITFGGVVDPINFAEGGFEYLVPVRFADNTDKAFQVAMQATTESQAIPGFDLIEELEPRSISQDFHYGGSKDHGQINGNLTVSEVNGRVQAFSPLQAGLEVFLPPKDAVPDGGPIFVFRNLSNSFALDLVDNPSGDFLFQMSTDSVAQLFMATVNGAKQWVFV